MRTTDPAKPPRLTAKQERFVFEYLVDLKPREAAIRAGYSPKTAHKIAWELRHAVRYSHVAAAIEAGQAAALADIGVERNRVLRELAAIGFSDIRKLYREDGSLKNPLELDDATAAAIEAIEVEELYEWEGQGDDRKRVNSGRVRKFKRASKLEALDKLGKYLALWKDQPPPAPEGPGLTVIVQNGVQIEGQRVTSATRVQVDLPKPE